MFAPGTQVTWTHVSKRGRTVSMTLREGVVVSDEGVTVTVRTKNGRSDQIAASALRIVGEKSTLTEFIETVFEHTQP